LLVGFKEGLNTSLVPYGELLIPIQDLLGLVGGWCVLTKHCLNAFLITGFEPNIGIRLMWSRIV
jgi:hypothetical protein